MSSQIKVGSLDKELYFGPTFLRGIIYVISVAILITIFELCFYCIHLAPMEHEHVIHKIQEAKHNPELKQSIIENVSNSNPNISDTNISNVNSIIESLNVKGNEIHAQAFVNTMTERELKLNYKINNDAIFIICIEIFIFMLIIFIVIQKLNTYVTTDKNMNIGYNTYYGAGVLPPIINAILTTIVLALFQINMYFFGQKWAFTSDYEIDHEITKELQKYLN